MKKFNLEYQYQQYLQLVELDESKMPEAQRVETRRAFFGACAQILRLLTDELPHMSDDRGAEVINKMIIEVSEFWNGEMKS